MKEIDRIITRGLNRFLKESQAGMEFPEDAQVLADYVENDLLENLVEIKSRLGLLPYEYKLEADYQEDGTPREFRHIILADYGFGENSPANKIPFRGFIEQLRGILSTGDDEVLVSGLNLGIKIVIRA